LENEFYRQYFQLLDSNRVVDDQEFVAMLEELEMLLPQDGAEERKLLIGIYRESIEILSRPFVGGEFDFGDPTYVQEIYEFGERMQSNLALKKLNSARGSRHAIYLNRAYFGLYNLLASLGSKIKVEMPELAKTRGIKV